MCTHVQGTEVGWHGGLSAATLHRPRVSPLQAAAGPSQRIDRLLVLLQRDNYGFRGTQMFQDKAQTAENGWQSVELSMIYCGKTEFGQISRSLSLNSGAIRLKRPKNLTQIGFPSLRSAKFDRLLSFSRAATLYWDIWAPPFGRAGKRSSAALHLLARTGPLPARRALRSTTSQLAEPAVITLKEH